MRSVHQEVGLYNNIEDRPTGDRPTEQRPHIWKNSNGHISARDRPPRIHFMFGVRWSFRGRRIEWHCFQLDQVQ